MLREILALKNNIENLKTQLETLIGTEEKTLWVNELDEFEKHYTKWLKDMEKRENKE